MKHILIEGGDALGKNTLITGLSKYWDFDNVMIRHFGKPPRKFPEQMGSLKFQAKCFSKEAKLVDYIRQFENDEFNYYENILIWNRAHLGEYVYGQMFRGQDPKEIESYLYDYEARNLIAYPQETFLILLTADPEFFLSKEDGHSFSQNLDEKTKELKLFEKIFDKSLIDNKFLIKVNDGDCYHHKDYIFNKVIDFIRKNNIII